LLRCWPTVEAALATERFELYLKHVQRQYSPERAEYMLGCLGQRPVFTGYSARETAHALLDKLSRQAAAAARTPEGAKTVVQAGHAGSAADGRSSADPTRQRLGTTVSGKKHASVLSPRAVAKRLRGRKANQEFLWWPYGVGLALLAVAMVIWAARRLG
jgi:hypothetical protein